MDVEKEVLTRDAYTSAHAKATKGGTQRATFAAEERVRQKKGIDPMADPKGLPHLGPTRLSLPRFVKQGDLWILSNGLPMPKETLIDTTGSMGNNVEKALEVLLLSYEMLSELLERYDIQIATSTFNDVEDTQYEDIPVLFRTQFEMGEKIPIQMALCAPGRNGHGNGKEDSQFGVFAAAYLTKAFINNYAGMKRYHITVSDEPIVETIAFSWLKTIFGTDVLDRIKENGYDFTAKNLPDTAQTIQDLQAKAHAFFFQVNNRVDVTRQWTDLYGKDHVVMLPSGTEYLHFVEAAVIGLTEGVVDLKSVKDFLCERGASASAAKEIVRAVAHIPLGAQTLAPNFNKLPKAGDVFKNKTDLWPVDASEINLAGSATKPPEGSPNWL